MDKGNEYYRRFLDGNDDGFVEIVRDYKDGLILFINGYVRNISIAEELAEDTFVKIGIKKPRFHKKSGFKTWLYSIGRNTAIDYIRKHSKETSVCIDKCTEISDGRLLETAYLNSERKAVIHKAIQRLKDEYRQVLWLLYFEELSNKEISKITGRSVHSVETLAYRARKTLKSELIKEGIEDYENLS